jgi:hypothetical protein
MPGLLFVSQAMLDSFAAQGRIDLAGNVMTVVAGDGKGRRYALEPAARFLQVVGGTEDAHALLHKVKSMAQLRALGAEPLGTSCVLGDVAYEVQPGYLADASALEAASAVPPGRRPGAAPAAPLGGAPLPENLEERRKEAEALARFLLENLSS